MEKIKFFFKKDLHFIVCESVHKENHFLICLICLAFSYVIWFKIVIK